MQTYNFAVEFFIKKFGEFVLFAVQHCTDNTAGPAKHQNAGERCGVNICGASELVSFLQK